jgi:hypothetical protein
MSRASVSIFVYGWYFLAMGLAMAVVPNLLLLLLGVAPTGEAWIRILGVVVTIIGLYYLAAARAEAVEFFRWTTWGRAIVLPAFVLLVVFANAPPMAILFGAIDAAGAVWTRLALRPRI